MDVETAAKLMGAAPAELVGVEEHLHGTVIHHRDGTDYVLVDDDSPDGEGKVGLMLAALPNVKGYLPIVPVFAPLPETPQAQAEADEVAIPAPPTKGKA